MIIICILLALLFLYGFIRFYIARKKLVKLDEDTKRQNEKLKQENKFFILERDKVIQDLNAISSLLEQTRWNLNQSQKDTEQSLKNCLINYCDNLDFAYQEAERQYDERITQLTESYENFLLKNNTLIDVEKRELERLRGMRQATIEANIREEEIKNQLDFYCLTPKSADINDIQALDKIKPQLNNPRILSMLIWSTYFQKDMTALCNKILGLNTVTGIYKITNQQNQKCYIGQSVDISKRWKDHAKCGLGIDTPTGNKLYRDMQDYGIWNFSWELLESCPREELNEKERYYINLYQSKDYGYNTTKGNN